MGPAAPTQQVQANHTMDVLVTVATSADQLSSRMELPAGECVVITALACVRREDSADG